MNREPQGASPHPRTDIGITTEASENTERLKPRTGVLSSESRYVLRFNIGCRVRDLGFAAKTQRHEEGPDGSIGCMLGVLDVLVVQFLIQGSLAALTVGLTEAIITVRGRATPDDIFAG